MSLTPSFAAANDCALAASFELYPSMTVFSRAWASALCANICRKKQKGEWHLAV